MSDPDRALAPLGDAPRVATIAEKLNRGLRSAARVTKDFNKAMKQNVLDESRSPDGDPVGGVVTGHSDQRASYEPARLGDAASVNAPLVTEAGSEPADSQAFTRGHLFQLGAHTLHSGNTSAWKIECDALTDADLAALAVMLTEVLPAFGAVEGVPRGGVKLAAALRPYVTEGPLLIVDDVMTTGRSLEHQRNGREAIGAVIFARQPCATWVTALFQTPPALRAAARVGGGPEEKK